MMTTISYE